MTIPELRAKIIQAFPYCLCEDDFTDGTANCQSCGKQRENELPEVEVMFFLDI